MALAQHFNHVPEEKRIFFIFTSVLLLNRLELPKDRTVGVKADEAKNIEEVLEPILRQYGLDIKEYDICLVSQYYAGCIKKPAQI